MNSPRRSVLITFIAAVLLLPASVTPGLAQTNAVSHSPAKVEPAWGKVIVIKGFSVPDDFRQWEIVNRLEVLVPVEFHVLGVMYLDTAGFVPEPGTEQVRVRVKVQGARWKIMEPILPPHVGQKRMLNVVRQAMLEEKDGVRHESLAALQAELRKARE